MPPFEGLFPAQGLGSAAPSNDLVEHGVDRGFMSGVGLEDAEVLEVGEQREQHLGANVGNLERMVKYRISAGKPAVA